MTRDEYVAEFAANAAGAARLTLRRWPQNLISASGLSPRKANFCGTMAVLPAGFLVLHHWRR